jgi:cytochrome c peroxidase
MQRSTVILLILLGLTAAGCRPAARYDPPKTLPESAKTPPEPPPAAKTPEPVDPLLAWMAPPSDKTTVPGLPMMFIAEDTDPLAWKNFPPDRTKVEQPTTSVFGVPALTLPGYVRIKVPRGLPDPSPLIPPANPLTLGKWELGRALFHDPTWLTAGKATSCATCHRPDRAFTDGLIHDGLRTPTLVNVVYNARQFSDGRVVYLEEVVQQSLDDERLPEKAEPFRHAWGGVLNRLNLNARYLDKFDTVFGTPPTQDAVGKALATYLRTLLAGDSLHDRAEAARRARGDKETLAVGDYEKVLDLEFLKSVEQPEGARTRVAERLVQGHKLFQEHCVRCHSGPLFTDHGFHNLGVGPPAEPATGTGLGRFASLPVGLKERDLVGAYATPSLRGLTRTGPYMHTGQMAKLEEVVEFHAHGGHPNGYLDPEYRKQQSLLGAKFEIVTKGEQADLMLFLRALGGTEVHPDIRHPKPPG